MVSSAIQEKLKPAEIVPQQASRTVASLAKPNIDQIEAICQEFLGRFRENVQAIFVTTYEDAQAEKERRARELAISESELRQMEAELNALQRTASQSERISQQALAGFRAQAAGSVALLVQKGIIAPEEADRRVLEATSELRARLDQAQCENEALAMATAKRVAELQGLIGQGHAAIAAMEARLAELQNEPAVAQHLAALETARLHEKEQASTAIHFLRAAPWGDLSRDRKITDRLRQAQFIGLHNLAVFDALVDRLASELSRVSSMPPAIAWSVIRVIEQLELQDMFPDLPHKRAALASRARAHKHEKRTQREQLPEKVISLASRWGARLATSR